MFEEKIAEINKEQVNSKKTIKEEVDVAFTFKNDKRVYTADEIQEILGVSRTTIYQLLKSHAFHYVRVGGQYRISRRSFDRWLEGESMEGCVDE
mgnify:CR=1 FL=1